MFRSDALLFYFVPVDTEQVISINFLLADVRRILKPKGRFISVEPHYIFWLLPWLGEVDRPFTILTEYLNKTFGVTATLSQLSKNITKADLRSHGWQNCNLFLSLSRSTPALISLLGSSLCGNCLNFNRFKRRHKNRCL